MTVDALKDRYGDPLPQHAVARMGTTRLRHSGWRGQVGSVSFSPDGGWLVSGGLDETLRVWQADSGQPVFAFRERPRLDKYMATVRSLAFWPTGERFVYVTPNNEVCIRETGTWREVSRFAEPSEACLLAISPDGGQLAVVSFAGLVYFWDAARREPGRLLQLDSQFWPGSIAFSPDGATLAIATYEPAVCLVDVTGGMPIRVLPCDDEDSASVLFSPDGRTMAVSAKDGRIRLWCTQTWDSLAELGQVCQGYVTALAFSPDGQVLASGDHLGTIRLWDPARRVEVGSWKGHLYLVASLSFSRDGTQLATGGGDNIVRVWDVVTRNEMHPFAAHAGAVRHIAFSADSTTLASAGEDNTVRLWDVATGAQKQQFGAEQAGVGAAAFSSDGKLVACREADAAVRVWDVTQGTKLRTFRAPDGISYAAFSADGRSLLGVCTDDRVRIWSLGDGALAAVIERPSGRVRSIAHSADSRYLAMGGMDGKVVVLDLLAGGAQTFSHGEGDEAGMIFAVAFSPAGRQLASSGDSRVCVWDLSTNIPVYRVEDFAYALAYSPDGRSLACGGCDGAIRVRDAATGDLRETLSGHGSAVFAVAFSPDRRFLGSGSADATALVWDVR